MSQLEEAPKRTKKEPTLVTTGLDYQIGKRAVVGKSEPDPQLKYDDWEGMLEARNRLEEHAREKITAFIENLDADIDKDIILERLAKASLLVVPETRRNAGQYESTDRIAVVFHQYNEVGPYQFHTAIHEMLHASSGQVFKLSGAGSHDRSELVIGLRRKNAFSWLNEAVTEALTCMAEGKDFYDLPASLSYISEVSLLREVIKVSGIPFRAFIEAYFEEPDLDAEPGKRMPKWHNLQKQLHSKFGPGLLREITNDENGRELKNVGVWLKRHQGGPTKIEELYQRRRDEKQSHKET